LRNYQVKNCSNKECTMKNPQQLSSFHKNITSKDGLSYKCKTCKKIYEDEYRKTHQKEIKVRAKIQRDKNPEYKNLWVKRNKERHSKIQKKSKNKNREKIKKKALDYYYKTREKQLRAAKKRRDENPEKEKARGRRFRQSINGKAKSNARLAKRRSAKLQRTPPWSTIKEELEIKQFYLNASKLTKETGIPHEVDHIIPLQGENVSGLHVPWNLQILSRSLNIRKGNRMLDENSDLYIECEKFKKLLKL
jgi:hypothetical protein